MGDDVLFLGSGAAIAPPHSPQSLVRGAQKVHDLRVAEHCDVGGGRDPIDQIARHRFREARPAHQHLHLARMAGEENRRLPRRVASAQQGHLFVAAESGLDRRGPVRDAAALELRQVRDLRAAIAGAGGHHHRPRPDTPAVGEVEDVHWIRARALGSAVQPLDLGGEAELHPELLRLGESARHQRLPRDTGGKAQIILNARAGAGLSSKGVRFQDQDREALRCSVDGGSHASGTGADDGHVVRLAAEGRCHQPEGPRQVLLRRVLEHRAVRDDHDRKLARFGSEAGEE